MSMWGVELATPADAGAPRRLAGVAWPFTRLAGLYLAVTLGIGLILIVLVPPFQVPDEPQHFERAYELSQGQLWSTVEGGHAGAYLPSSVVDFIDCFPSRRPDGGPRPAVFEPGCTRASLSNRGGPPVFARFEGSAFYSPVAYTPQILGIWLGKFLGAGVYKQLLASRLLNLLASALIVFLALDLAPAVSPLVLAVALLPMSLFEMASASPDALTIASSLFFFAAAVRASERGSWSVRGGAAACLCAVCFLSLKPVYAPLLLLPIALTICSREKRGRVGRVSAVIACGAAASALLWLRSSASAFKLHIPDVDPARQAHLLLSHVSSIPALIARTLVQNGGAYIESLFGVLGWWNIFLPGLVYICCATACLSAALLVAHAHDRTAKWVHSCFALAIVVFTFLLILLAMYLIWSKVGASIISGVQGRYLLPLAPIFLLAVSYTSPAMSAAFRRRVGHVFVVTVPAPALAMVAYLTLIYGSGGLDLLPLG